MTNPEPVAPPPPPAPPASTFNAGMLLVGLLVSVPAGAVANIIAGLMGASTNNKVAAFAIGIVPGALFVGLSLLVRRNGFAQGLCIGGCIVALIGGICGAAITPLDFR
jgi:uncharacterized membrane protein YdjX (TVP38/TMEM64 family)